MPASLTQPTGLYAPPAYIVSFAEAHGLSPARANATLSALNAASALGRLLPAYLADRAGNFNLLAPAAALCGVACLVVAGCLRGLSECLSAVAGVDMVASVDAAASACAPSLASIVAFAAVYGFLSGAFISVVTPCVAQISPAERVGARVGMLYSAISIP